MLILSFVFILLILVSIFDFIKIDVGYKILIFIGYAILLSCLAAFRYGDRDYGSYLDIYEQLGTFFSPRDTSDVHGEPGYILLNIFCKSFGLGSIGVFIIMAFTSVGLSLNFFRKNTKYFFVALLIYFSHVFILRDMLQIRSGLAASISLYSLVYVQRRQIFKFGLIICLAISFHYAAAIMCLIYIIYPFTVGKPKRILYLICSGYILGILISATVLTFFFTEVWVVPGVSLYINDSEYFKPLGLLNPVLVKSLVFFLLVYYFKDELATKNELFEVFLLSAGLSIFWLAAFNQFALFAGRLATFFSNSELILIPSLFYTRLNKPALWGVIIIYCIIMFIPKFEVFDELNFYFLTP